MLASLSGFRCVFSTVLMGFCVADATAQTMPTYEDLTRSAAEMQKHLPTLEELTAPKGYETYREISQGIARQSAGETMGRLRDLATEQGLLEVPRALADPRLRELPEDLRATILISMSMGEEEIKSLIRRYAHRKDVRFALRGIPADQTIPTFAQVMHTLATEAGAADGIDMVIDPNIFELVSARAAPTVVLEDTTRSGDVVRGKDIGQVIMTAVGFSDPDYAFREYSNGSSSVARATGSAITEEDIRVRAEREAEAVVAGLTQDPTQLRDRFWSGKLNAMRALPVVPAFEDRERVLHFAWVAPEDIRNAQGNILAHKGQVYTPDQVLPFDRRIFVFDATSKAEIDHVLSEVQSERPGVVRTVFIVTNLPDDLGGQRPWERLQELVDQLGAPVYVLDNSLRASFQIERTPTEVYPRASGANVDVIALETNVGGA